MVLTLLSMFVIGKSSCFLIAEYLNGAGFVPDARAQYYCVIFDKDVYEGNDLTESSKASIAQKCGVSLFNDG